MIAEKPNVNLDGRYTPKETAMHLGICSATLYRLTSKGHIRCGFRKSNKRRFYLGRDIIKLWADKL